MKLEHFLHYSKNGVGYRLIKTPRLDKILSDNSRHYLCRLDGVTPTQTFLPEEQMVAISYFDYTLDEYNRRNTWNHTILIHLEKYLKLDPEHVAEYFRFHIADATEYFAENPHKLMEYFNLYPPTRFEQFFIKPTEDLPECLEPLRINTK